MSRRKKRNVSNALVMSLAHSRSLLLAGDHASDLIVLWRCEWWLMLLWPASSCCVGCVAWLWWWGRAVPCCLLFLCVFSHSTYSIFTHPFCLLLPPPPYPPPCQCIRVYIYMLCQSSLSFSSPINAVAFFLVLLLLVFSQSLPPHLLFPVNQSRVVLDLKDQSDSCF